MAVAPLRPPTSCPRCGSEVVQHVGRGRPKVYCSTQCRRLTEFEIRRVQRHLGDAERRVSYQRERVAEIQRGASWLGTLVNAREQLAEAERRVAERGERLEHLLGG